MLVISSIKSGAGKTTIASGLVGVFYALKLDFEFVKIGPDFLDCACVSNFACVNRVNLVPQCSKQFYRWIVWVSSFSLVEDCMGIMDSLEGERFAVSSLLLNRSKFVLALDCGNVMQTAAHLSSAVCCKLSGVILNNVASYRHEAVVVNTVCSFISVPILGVLQADAAHFEQRHLGVIQPNELISSQSVMNNLILKVYYGCNVSKLVRLMASNDS
ncbi:Hydrogenobyrinate a,c-diamide synthase [Candidatus Hodgkinia cicadicola]|nr:Hydrogenobyrinate a,c-diamide synthase [Candidatus Hodgkinia cicadicola]